MPMFFRASTIALVLTGCGASSFTIEPTSTRLESATTTAKSGITTTESTSTTVKSPTTFLSTRLVNGYTVERGADLSGADLSNADLSGADLSFTDLSCANLSNTNLSNADLSHANLSYVIATGAGWGHGDPVPGGTMTLLLFDGVTCPNRRGANLNGANLSNAKLFGADLSCADLTRANLAKADLSYSNLSHTFMFWARHPDLRHNGDPRTPPVMVEMIPILRCADPGIGANLANANLSNANQFNTYLRGAILPDGTIQQ